MSGFVIDSWAWFEYFYGSAAGNKVKKILEGHETIYCTTTSIAELTSKLTRRGFDSERARQTILANSQTVPLDEAQAYDAGLIHAEMRRKIIDFGMADAIVLACARKLNAKVITGDPHFKDVKDAVLI